MSNNIIRQQRLTNLRNALNVELSRRGLSKKSFATPTINITPVKTTDIVDIRNAIN